MSQDTATRPHGWAAHTARAIMSRRFAVAVTQPVYRKDKNAQNA